MTEVINFLSDNCAFIICWEFMLSFCVFMCANGLKNAELVYNPFACHKRYPERSWIKCIITTIIITTSSLPYAFLYWLYALAFN